MPDSIENTQTTTRSNATGHAPSTETPPANTPPPKEEGDQLDDLGYPVVEEKTTEGKVPPAKEEETTPPPKEEEVIPPASGYGETPPKVEDDTPTPPKEEEPPPTEESFKIEDPGDLLKEEVTELTEFINKNKVPKNIADALVTQKKAEVKKLLDLQADKEKETQRIRAGWHEELKADKDFGGENFSKSVQQAEKVLHDFFPGMKKRLTDSSGMLPPYVMKDLAKLAGHLYSSEKLTTGDPSVPTPPEQEKDDSLAFYDS